MTSSTTDWSQLSHAFGSAEDIPALLDQLVPDPHDDMWGEVWGRLCHQGSTYSASYAALPVLTGKARQWPVADRAMVLALSAAIVDGSGPQNGGDHPRAVHAAEIAELTAMTEQALSDPAFASEPVTYAHLMQSLLCLEGVEIWSEQFDNIVDGEFEVCCPRCEEENFVVLGELAQFTTQDPSYMSKPDAARAPLTPAQPDQLSGLGQRLHSRALADGQSAVARLLTCVFGGAQCLGCGTQFRVDEAIVDTWSG